jgi:choline kinase
MTHMMPARREMAQPRRGRMTRRAIVLAAGKGSRLVRLDEDPKPLKAIAEVPLLVRILRTLQAEGIDEAVVVVGDRGDRIRAALAREPSLSLRLAFVDNPDFERKNGVSLLAAARWVDRECLLTMADHLYSPELVRRLQAFELPEGACALAVDRDRDRCFDIDDATKVRLDDDHITGIGKELERYDAIDTGVFRIGPALIEELRQVERRTGDCSLSDGVGALAARGQFLACGIGQARWIDVDTPEAAREAETMLRLFGETLSDLPVAVGSRPDAVAELEPSWLGAA